MDKSSIQNRDVFNMAVGDRMVTIMGYLSDVESGSFWAFNILLNCTQYFSDIVILADFDKNVLNFFPVV